MAEHEMTMHATGAHSGAVTLKYANGFMVVETVQFTPPMYPDTRPGTRVHTVVLDLEDFLRGVDSVTTEVAEDQGLPATVRAAAWRGDLAEVATVVSHAATEDEADLTRAGERVDWVMDLMGIGAVNYRMAVAEERVHREGQGDQG